jgi:hypothetical protein
VKKSLKEQKHFIPPTRDKVQEGAKKKAVVLCESLRLCVFA